MKRTPHSTWVLLILALGNCTCGGIPGKQGSLDELLSGKPPQTDEIPLAARALNVEQVTTELDPQIDEYRIGPNDVLNITVLGHEELSSARDFNRGIVGTIVKKDGHIYLPIVGRIKAEGFTVEQFHRVLAEALAGYVKTPQLTVDVLKYESQKFYVLGQVNNPGAFPVNGQTTLLEAIGLAQGIKSEGSLEQAYMIRGKTLLPINLANLLLRGDTSRNVFMRHGDLVYVPSAEDQKVYILGEVLQPKAVQIPHGRLSLAQALAECGGLLSVEADEGSIKLVRGNWQEPTVYTLNYETVLAHGDRIYLVPGDRVVVQPTTLTLASRYMQQILPFLMGADSGTAVYDRISR